MSLPNFVPQLSPEMLDTSCSSVPLFCFSAFVDNVKQDNPLKKGWGSMTWKKAVFIWEEEKTEVVIVWEVFLFACFFYFGKNN